MYWLSRTKCNARMQISNVAQERGILEIWWAVTSIEMERGKAVDLRRAVVD